MEEKSPIENEISYVPMEEDFREEVKRRYVKPRRINMTVLTSVFLGFALILFFTFNSNDKVPNHSIWDSILAVVAIFLFKIFYLYLVCALFFLRYKICYLKDANFGQIAKEKVHITKVMETPAGLNIYWVDSDSVMTFIPEPYRNFKEGDAVTIYYLKYSKEYLAYEV